MKKTILMMIILIMLTSNVANAQSLDTDKVLHFSAGALIYSTADYFYSDNPMKYVVAGAVTKELYDFYNSGTVEMADIGYTIAGGIFADWFRIRLEF